MTSLSLDTRKFETVFDKGYEGILFTSTALHGPQGKAVRDAVNGMRDLPADIGELLKVLGDNRSDARQVAEIAGSNPAVAAKILRVANSSYTGLRGKVTDLKRAVTLLGYNHVTALIVGIAHFSKNSKVPLPARLPLKELWKHSTSVGLFSGIIAEKLGNIDAALLVSAGFLHDTGKLVMAKAFGDAFAEALRDTEDTKGDLLEIELKEFGMTHPIAAAALCQSWNLPERLYQVIAAQEYPSLFHDYRTGSCLLLGERAARLKGIGADGQPGLEQVPEEILNHLDISQDAVERLIGPEEMLEVAAEAELACM